MKMNPRLRIRMVSLVTLGTALLAGCAGWRPTVTGGRLNATERMMWSTYPILTQSGAATGFIIQMPDARGRVPPVMVTSLHVVETIGRAPFIVGMRAPNVDGSPRVAPLMMQPEGGKKTRFYVRHPKHDIAAFRLDLGPVAELLSPVSFLNESSFAPRGQKLRAGTDVSFLGFPDVMPGTAGAFPVLRSGKVASYSADASRSEPYFLIDSDVYPGDSGAPVFAAGRGARPVLAGLILRRVADNQTDFSHLAIAVEAEAIRETLRILADREAGISNVKSTADKRPRKER
jgi:hypothetical protein